MLRNLTIARYFCVGAVFLTTACSPLRDYTRSKGFIYIPNSDSGQLMGKNPDDNFSSEPAIIPSTNADHTLSKIEDTITIPLSFAFAPKDLRINAKKTNLTLGFSPSYSIFAARPYSLKASIVAPRRMLLPSETSRVVFAELHTGIASEVWGGSASIGSSVDVSDLWNFKIEGDARRRNYDDILIGFKTKLFKPEATSQVTLKKDQKIIDAATDTAIKFESVFYRDSKLIANIHIIPNQGALGLNPTWADTPSEVQRLRLNGKDGKLANGGLAWNSARGLQPLAQTEVVLPMEASQSANDIAVVFVSDTEFLIIRLEQLRPSGNEAVVSIQKVSVR